MLDKSLNRTTSTGQEVDEIDKKWLRPNDGNMRVSRGKYGRECTSKLSLLTKSPNSNSSLLSAIDFIPQGQTRPVATRCSKQGRESLKSHSPFVLHPYLRDLGSPGPLSCSLLTLSCKSSSALLRFGRVFVPLPRPCRPRPICMEVADGIGDCELYACVAH